MISNRPNRAKRPPSLRCSMRLPNRLKMRPLAEPIRPAADTTTHVPSPAIEAFAGQAQTRRLPLRFTWQMDRDGRFTLGSDEFLGLIGPRTAAAFGRPWREIAETLGVDPAGRMMQAFATGTTWSGITLNWPADGGGTLPVELSGLPVFDAARNFIGYRGFGVCRDFDAIARLAALRQAEVSGAMATPQEPPAAPSADELPEPIAAENSAAETSHQNDLETPVEPPKESPEEAPEQSVQENVENIARDVTAETATALPAEIAANVLPFRAPGDAKQPVLTPVENSAFDELARQLSARLDTENDNQAPIVVDETIFASRDEAAAAPPEWLAAPEPPARGEAARDKALLDLLPVGILIYRLDRLLYANPAFLAQMGYPNLHALEDAGGLDALYVEPGVSNASSTSDTGRPVRISASQPADAETDTPPSAADARLYTISWGGNSALALIFSGTRHESAAIAAAMAQAEPVRGGTAPEASEPAISDPNRRYRSPNRRRSGTPGPKTSPPSSTPRPKAS